MKNRRKNREAFAQHSYWQSYSDMMAALLLIFILIIAITLAIYKQKTTALEKTQLALDQAKEQLNLTMEDLERSKAEIEKSNEELASSLAELESRPVGRQLLACGVFQRAALIDGRGKDRRSRVERLACV